MATFEAQERGRAVAVSADRIKSSSQRQACSARTAYWAAGSDAGLVLAVDGTVLDANPAARDLLRDTDEPVGSHLDELVDRARSIGDGRRATAAAVVAAFERERQAGAPRWTLRPGVGRGVVVPDIVDLSAAGGGAMVLLRRAQSPAGAPEDAYPIAPALEQMVRGTTEAVVVIDAEQTIVHFNPGAEHLFGWSCAAVIGRRLDVLLPEEARHAHAGYVKAFLSEGNTVRWMNDRADLTALRADGTTFQAEATILASDGPDGGVCAAVLRDVSERRQQEARLRESVSELKQARYMADMANRAKSEFLASISHELRTPINAMIGFAHIMHSELHGPLGSHRYVGYAQDIQESAERLLTLVNDVLDVSRIEADRVVLAPECVAIDTLFASCERLIAPRAAAQRVSLFIDPGPPNTRLFVDPRFMKQVLVNLLSNAVKFTEGGGRVHLSAALAADGGVRLRVADNGIGISRDHVKRIFEPFVQADGSLARRFEGSGLGLMLVRSLTELHGGSVTIDSQPGVGTTVEIALPPSTLADRGSDD